MKVRDLVLAGMILPSTVPSQIVKDQARMEAKIESRRYCEVDSKKTSLAINFSVVFKNTTISTITMHQPIHVLPLVSRTLPDLQHKKYELTLYSPETFGLVKPDNKVPEAATDSRQTSVEPGEMFTAQAVTTPFPIALDAKLPTWEALGPGIHFVQLVLDSEIQGTATFVRITSQPIEIIVDNHPKVNKCL